MNINLEYPLFRFVVPPSIFCGILVLSKSYEYFSIYNLISDYSILVIFFVALGFIISAIGTGIARVIDSIYKPVWYIPSEEVQYWCKIGLQTEYFQKKIENTWGFYSMNINSLIAIIFATVITLFTSGVGCSVALVLFSLLMLFIGLARLSYKKIFEIGQFSKNELLNRKITGKSVD